MSSAHRPGSQRCDEKCGYPTEFEPLGFMQMDNLPEVIQFVIYDYAGAPLINALLKLGELNPRYGTVVKWKERTQVLAKDLDESDSDDELETSTQENEKVQLRRALGLLARNGDTAGFKRLLPWCEPLYDCRQVIKAALVGAGNRLTALMGRREIKMTVDASAVSLIRLIEQSADRPVSQDDVDLVIDDAAEDGDSAAISFLLDLRQRSTPSNLGPNRAPNPVQLAFARGRLDNMKVLLDRGIPRPKLSVFEAARRGHRDVCDWLLAGGADRVAAFNGAAFGGRAGLVKHLGFRRDRAGTKLTVGFYRGAADPANHETLLELKELGWLQVPAERRLLLKYAFEANNAVLVEELLKPSLSALSAPGETGGDVLEYVWDSLLKCAARGGERTLQLGIQSCSLVSDMCRLKAQELLDAQVGLFPTGVFETNSISEASELTALAPPHESISLLHTLRSWGARIDIIHVRYAAICCSRALFREVFETAAPEARALYPKIFCIVARRRATIGRLAMIQSLAFPEGIPHKTIRKLVQLQERIGLGFHLRALAPLAAKPHELSISVGTSAVEACHLGPDEALAFFRLGSKLVAFQLVECWRRRKPCAQAALIEAFLNAPDADKTIIKMPESFGVLGAVLCTMCEKALEPIRPPTRKHKRKLMG